MNTAKTTGFTIIEIVILLVVFVMVIGLGYAFFATKDTQMASTSQSSNSQSSDLTQSEPVTAIESPSDLDKATYELDHLEIDDTSDDKSLSSMSNF